MIKKSSLITTIAIGLHFLTYPLNAQNFFKLNKTWDGIPVAIYTDSNGDEYRDFHDDGTLDEVLRVMGKIETPEGNVKKIVQYFWPDSDGFNEFLPQFERLKFKRNNITKTENS